jgi:hypothetical protein
LVRIPIIRVLGGVAFVLAGLLAYYGITFGNSAFLLFILAGAAVIVVAVSGHRPPGGDIAIFILGVLVLSGVAAGYSPGNQVTTYSATTDQVHATKIVLSVSADTGSVSILFGDRGNLAYQVNFTRSFGPFVFPLGNGENVLTNSTSGGVLNLKTTSSTSDVKVYVRRGYSVNVTATTGTGSIDLTAPSSEDLRSISLSTTTGSVNAVVDSSTIQSLDLRTTTGSINLASDQLGTSGQKVPVTVSTSLGSLNIRLNIAASVAVSLQATTGLGSINHDLVGFSVTTDKSNNLVASYGSPGSAPHSFLVSTSTDLGSQDLTIKILP